MAEEEGFEPSEGEPLSGFQDRRLRPLGHSSRIRPRSIYFCGQSPPAAPAEWAHIRYRETGIKGRTAHGLRLGLAALGAQIPGSFGPALQNPRDIPARSMWRREGPGSIISGDEAPTHRGRGPFGGGP